jgi:hypothetical protein
MDSLEDDSEPEGVALVARAFFGPGDFRRIRATPTLAAGMINGTGSCLAAA